MLNPNATHLLIRHQEIALKGKNRAMFENRLCQTLRRCTGENGHVFLSNGRLFVELKSSDSSVVQNMIERISTMGGVRAVTPCAFLQGPTPESIETATIDWAKKSLDAAPNAKTFAIRARRVDKKFPLSSEELNFKIGPQVKLLRDGLTVDLKRAELKISVEVRERITLIYSWERLGVSGLPMDTSQRVVCLLSGGIDSPVAAYNALRRGCTPVLVHFHSKPFTSEASIDKVKRLAGILRQHSPYPLELWLVPLLEIQKSVRDICNERYRTVHYRRFMMRIAEELAKRREAHAIITGEALGQVASQTLTNMHAIGDVVKLPVLRPLVMSDKDQIIAQAKALGFYETSIEPHDDTCVLFAPERPSTQARISVLREEDDLLPVYELVFAALDRAEKVLV